VRTVVLYGRPGCHLCEDARAGLLRMAERRPFRLREIDIERDPELLRRYLERIPVICVDGEEICDLFLDEEALAARL
jgi:glutaredoxin